jgi:outer membrane protein
MAVAGAVLAGVVALAATAHAAAVPGKVGYVNINKAMLEVADGKKAKDSLKKEFDEKQKLLDAKQEDFKKASEAFEKKKALLTPAALKDEEAALQKMYIELQTLYYNLQNELAEKEKKLTEPILLKFECILKKMGEADGYSMIFPDSAILWAPDHLDLTSEMIRKYEDGVCKDVKVPVAPAGTGGPKPAGTAKPGTAKPATAAPKAATAAPKPATAKPATAKPATAK